MLTRIETEYTKAARTGVSADRKAFVVLVEQTCFKVSFASLRDGKEVLEKIKKACEEGLAEIEKLT